MLLSPTAISLMVFLPIIALIIGMILGWYLAKKVLQKQIKDTPMITSAQVRELYSQIGRKPSEKQIQQIIANFKK